MAHAEKLEREAICNADVGTRRKPERVTHASSTFRRVQTQRKS